MILPIWLLALLMLAGLLLAYEVGFALRVRAGEGELASQEDVSIGAVLGLLSLLLGFTFSLCLERYDTRRELVVAESNALDTVWLRTSLLDDNDRNCVRNLLREYVDNRVRFGTAEATAEALDLYRDTSKLQDRLWQRAEAAVRPLHGGPLGPFVLGPLNSAFDLATERAVAREAQVPTRMLSVLALYGLIAAGMIGRAKGRRSKATTTMFVLLTLAGTLIVDLDRPSSGPIQVPQGSMQALHAAWHSMPELMCTAQP